MTIQLTKLVNDALTRDGNGRGFDSRQVHHFKMRLTKYQKARLLEFNWNTIHNESCEDNTRWLHFDTHDGVVFERVKRLLDVNDTATAVKILVVATQSDK